MRKLWLKKHEDRRLRAGHLWVFGNEVDGSKSPLPGFEPGEAATLCDARGAPLGSVYVNPASLICARLYSRRPETELDAGLLRTRLAAALALRQRLYNAPWYRLCHGEGDFLPGLVLDRFGGHLTAQVTTAGMERRREALESCLHELFAPTSILWDNDLPARALEGLAREPSPWGDVPETLEVPENGCRFRAPCATGQKTGWFYDQRRNRRELARYAKGADVLDIFSYVGGFGVTCAAAGAASVTFVDAAREALDYALANAAANAPGCPAEALCGNAFQILRELCEAGRRFDCISLDPPAFIKRRKDLPQGLAAYRQVNALAVALLKPGGVLASSSCSHHLEAQTLRDCLTQAAAKSKLHTRLLFAGGQGPDHPVQAAMPETAYLKCCIAQVGP
ncbi:class I SAM-dependent rRNA methyltransferase [Desulfovibrio legallii]|uniref:SAM-dependent methyltransferase n=1 Tax=Desulfovibrio legallii TaxID=571438 RepID=A0A1G7JL01_9BACT|nr:class I SAM-dependent rRNA methyltransferase [Desulfovibrio legallii]SDF25566.1 SAM-dependent methyltransferase [Desulfovibrio legallii]